MRWIIYVMMALAIVGTVAACNPQPYCKHWQLCMDKTDYEERLDAVESISWNHGVVYQYSSGGYGREDMIEDWTEEIGPLYVTKQENVDSEMRMFEYFAMKLTGSQRGVDSWKAEYYQTKVQGKGYVCFPDGMCAG